MKIAYLISGHTKYYDSCLKNHSRIFNIFLEKGHDIDCFISTYNTTGKLKDGIKFHDLRTDNDHEKYKNKDEYTNVDLINNCFKPKLLELEIETKYTEKLPELYTRITSTHDASFYHISRMYKKFIDVIRLMERYEFENNFKYDFFIRTRFDIISNIEHFYFDNYLHGLLSNSDFHDLFFYGNRNLLDKIKRLDDFLNEIFVDHVKIKNSDTDMNKSIRIPYRNSEDLFTNFLKKESIEYKIDNINVSVPRI